MIFGAVADATLPINVPQYTPWVIANSAAVTGI